MKFYDFSEIRDAGSCITFAEQILGCDIDRNGRCQAKWRGGDGRNVAVKRDEWYDHKTKEGGGLIELCMAGKFPNDKQQAQNFLGEWLGLQAKYQVVKAPPSSGRYDELIAQGYQEVKRYGYEDTNSNLVHFVARLEHPEKEKQFMQGTPDGWGLRKVTPILYRMKDWIASTFVCIVEGEKDADTLLELGIPATTNCGGADKWRPEYTGHFSGKNVIIVKDNDDAGTAHADRVSRELKDAANRIVIVCPSSEPKGDVTDWIQNEGGTKEAFLEMVKAAPLLDLSTLENVDPLVEAAKQANKSDFANFTEHMVKQGNISKPVKTARQINAVIEEVHKRFVGFPRKVGGSRFLFDHDRETGEIVHIHKPSELFAWIGRKSKRKVSWSVGDSFITKGELFDGLFAEAQSYEAISHVPDWPKRDDVYYVHEKLPEPSPDYEYFNDFIDFFFPANDAYRTMLKAFVCAPLWYINGIPRPGWIIDSEDGAGVGKTTLVELIARLYSGSAIRTNKQELKTDVTKLVKRTLSTEGRRGRIVLVDNVTGQFNCAELADFMTAESISGLAAYGRGEETRPNNLTYVITANSATVDNDLSDRCYYVVVKKPTRSGNWKSDILEYIEKFRLNIIADIIGLLNSGDNLEAEPKTRFPEFEEKILRAVCNSETEYEDSINVLADSRSASNVEDDHAKTIEDEFQSRLIEGGFTPGSQKIFLRTDVIKLWMNEIFENELNEHPAQYLRNLTKNGLTTRFNLKPERFPISSGDPRRRRGIMWMPIEWDGCAERIVGCKGKKAIEIQ